MDIHAPIVPDSLWRAIDAKKDRHGFRHKAGEGPGAMDGRMRHVHRRHVAQGALHGETTPEGHGRAKGGCAGALHPQPQNNFLAQRTQRHGLNNSLGVILDDAMVTAALICGGVLEKCPELRVCIAHGGGPACYAMGRLDRNWHDRPSTRSTPKPPSAYQKQLYYDTVTGSEEALRFLPDQVGADRVVMGSDWPFVPWHPSPVTWLENRETRQRERKKKSTGKISRRCSTSHR